jgi:ring-1,2-phenylacetyl-CoA epoxidase subunit PaaB
VPAGKAKPASGAKGAPAKADAPKPASNRSASTRADALQTDLALWEVFTQPSQGAPHEHAGSVHAADAEQAMQNARDVYARRGEAISLWVVPSSAIVASAPGDAGPFFDPGNDKPYRHPQFYKVPRGVKVF